MWQALTTFAVLLSLATGPVSSGTAKAAPQPTSLGIGCPSPGENHGIRLWVHVLKWCGVPGVKGQVQIKLQIAIRNDGRRRLGVGLTHIRLVVTRFDPRRWRPPSGTSERPFTATYQGARYWTIPANPEGAADPIPGQRDTYTFATHWGNASPLQPGQTFRPVNHRRGNVVFYVPKVGARSRYLDGVAGLAYVSGHRILVVCPPDRWVTHVSANLF
jgi:hypothetical protein